MAMIEGGAADEVLGFGLTLAGASSLASAGIPALRTLCLLPLASLSRSGFTTYSAESRCANLRTQSLELTGHSRAISGRKPTKFQRSHADANHSQRG